MIRKSLSAIDRDFISEMMSGYRASCVLGAGAELDVFTPLSLKPQSSETWRGSWLATGEA